MNSVRDRHQLRRRGLCTNACICAAICKLVGVCVRNWILLCRRQRKTKKKYNFCFFCFCFCFVTRCDACWCWCWFNVVLLCAGAAWFCRVTFFFDFTFFRFRCFLAGSAHKRMFFFFFLSFFFFEIGLHSMCVDNDNNSVAVQSRLSCWSTPRSGLKFPSARDESRSVTRRGLRILPLVRLPSCPHSSSGARNRDRAREAASTVGLLGRLRRHRVAEARFFFDTVAPFARL